MTVDAVPVELTDTEYRILLALAEQPGRVLTHGMLLDRLWGPGYAKEVHYLRVYVDRVRSKVEPDHAAPRLLVTVPRAGYRLEASPEPTPAASVTIHARPASRRLPRSQLWNHLLSAHPN